MGFFDRLANGFELAKSSCQVLREAKSLIIFPILSGVSCLIVLGSFAIPFIAHPQWLDFLDAAQVGGRNVPAWTYAVAFAFYFCNYFVIVFFNAALISAAMVGFHGSTPTVGDGLNAALSRLPQILAWALVSATVGLLLRVIENAHEKVGSLIRAVLGSVWTLCTFFVVPVLVVEKVGPFQAVARSFAILKKTWGEGLGGSAGIRLFVFLMMLPGLLIGFLGFTLLATSTSLALAVLALAFFYLIGVGAIGSALDGILVAALYLYASYGEVPQGFQKSRLSGAFQPARQ
jgi:hypothetical protein